MTGREARQKTGAMETVYVLFNGDAEHYDIEPCKIFEVDVTHQDWWPGTELKEAVCFLGVKKLSNGERFKVKSDVVFSDRKAAEDAERKIRELKGKLVELWPQEKLSD